MVSRRRGDEREAKPVARRRPAALQPVEPPQHLLALLLRNAGAAVSHLEHRAAAFLSGAQADRRAIRRVAECILDEICECLADQALVTRNRERRGREVQDQRASGLFGVWPVDLRDTRRQRVEIEGHRGKAGATALDLGDAEEALEHGDGALGLGQRAVRQPRLAASSGQAVAEVVQQDRHPLQRCLEVMCDVGGDLFQCFGRGLLGLGHAVDPRADPGKVVGPARLGRNAGVECAFREAGERPLDPFHPRPGTGGERRADPERDQHRGPQAEGEEPEKGAAKLADRRQAFADDEHAPRLPVDERHVAVAAKRAALRHWPDFHAFAR